MSRTLSEVLKAAGLRRAKIGKSGDLPSVSVPAEEIVELMRVLRQKMGADSLDCMTAVDCGDEFELVYHAFSYATSDTFVGKARVPRANPIIESVSGVYPAASWFEREVFDMFGVEFTNHPNLVRMLRRDDQPGHPLRKDYQLRARIPAVEDAD